ncbi:uncharacterized protein PADG_12440 [Paracoccidioides brasiliensis Pb18]|uniref:Uncharacterized protein n=1 Tax=Paracoccidioides brasiliensis (strain Pb18) TaxID=502780 RepID=A0A0A0HS14_PARBD|nr:uncharacterized protein PADG_12440 [Paracoccidioides brasiliensis Pb18]KGM91457.1 hypothetical protein PADG_12440 [Paracoccidioides brasiliensis Pb18]
MAVGVPGYLRAEESRNAIAASKLFVIDDEKIGEIFLWDESESVKLTSVPQCLLPDSENLLHQPHY